MKEGDIYAAFKARLRPQPSPSSLPPPQPLVRRLLRAFASVDAMAIGGETSKSCDKSAHADLLLAQRLHCRRIDAGAGAGS